MQLPLSFLLALLLYAFGSSAIASAQPSQARLNQLKQQIAELETTLNKSNQQRSRIIKSLKKIEVKIGQLSQDLATLKKRLASTTQHLEQLQQQQQLLIHQKQSQVATLVELIREEYSHRQETSLKLLLSGQQPGKFARQLQYQRYIEEAKKKQVARLNQSLTKLAQLSQKVIDSQRQQKSQQHNLATKQHDLKTEKNKRNTLLATIEQDINQQENKIDSLKANRQHLQKMLDGMRDAISDIPANSGKPFPQLKHQLPWPVKGKLEHAFRSIRSGTLRWDGAVLATNSGQPVRAVAAGRVIFADWLTGYGLMVIIDQGNGYMTLYGYNENLTTRVGDWVSQGATIAHAGNSGGQRKSALYFGVRHNGKPINPATWCSSKRQFN